MLQLVRTFKALIGSTWTLKKQFMHLVPDTLPARTATLVDVHPSSLITFKFGKEDPYYEIYLDKDIFEMFDRVS